MKDRIIFHIDVNNAYLSWTAVEMLKNGFNEDIRLKDAVIGGSEELRKGIVLAKSNPAKKKGIVTGESLYNARKKCPNLVVYPPNFLVYKKYSEMMFDYLSKYSPDIERFSIDECFIDYTNCQSLFGDPIELAYKIKDDIKNKFGFTVNIGVANNKLCAKMASDFEKPDKVHTLFQNEISDKLWPIDVSELFMIGKKSSEKLKSLGIKTVYDLAHTDLNLLVRHFKSMGNMMYNYAHGIDNSKVESEIEEPKSISSSTVLPYDYTKKEEIYKVIRDLANDVGKRIRKHDLYAYVIYTSLKYNDFSKVSKQKRLDNSINSDIDIYNEAIKLFETLWNGEALRNICVGVNNFSSKSGVQLSIFKQNQNEGTNDKLQKTIDKIRKKYGDNTLMYGDMMEKKDKK